MFRRSALDQAKEFAKALESDDVLEGLGLMRKSEERSWFLPALGGLGLGLICGVAMGFAFAPKRGEELRGDVANKLKNRDFKGLAETARSGFSSSSGTQATPTVTTGGRSSTVI